MRGRSTQPQTFRLGFYGAMAALALGVPLGSCQWNRGEPIMGRGARDDRGAGPTHARRAPGVQPQSPGAGPGAGNVVTLCDGETTTTVPNHAALDRTTGASIAAALMSQWTARHPEREWAPDPDPAHNIVAPADNSAVLAARPDAGGGDAGVTQGLTHAYGNYTPLEVLTWQRELQRQVAEGDRVFHDADALGSTIAVSCDMCHPNAANTHPETYPKFQVQLGRVVLLRDMINWCLQHPVRAPAMSAEDPRMRAMEMYIYAQRRGVALNYGRH